MLKLFITFCCSCSLTLFAQEIDLHWFNQGVEQNNRGEDDRALLSFNRFLTTYPQVYPQAYFHRGYLYFHQKNYTAAIADFKTLHQLEQKNKEATYALGRSFVRTFHFQKAIDYFSETIQLSPNFAAAYNDRGMAFCQLRVFDQALEDFYRATSLDTNFAMAYNNTGVARYFSQDIAKPSQKDLITARDWFSQAIEQDPTLALAYRNRAAMNIFLKNQRAAVNDLKKAKKLAPDDAMVFFYFGVVYSDLAETDKAIQAFEKTLELQPQLSFAYEELGNLYKTQKQFAKAIEQYQRAKTARPSNNKLYIGLMDYRIALTQALQEKPIQMYAALKSARKAKTFSDMRVYRDFLKAKEFKNFRSDKRFRRFTKSIRKGKKDNKFLHPDLGWFRMRKE